MTPDWFAYLGAFLVGVLAVGRLTRLIVDDTFPPTAWLRQQWAGRAPGAWADLATCAFCLAPWFGLASLTWAYLSHLSVLWWLFHVWLAGSYAASIVVVRDTPD